MLYFGQDVGEDGSEETGFGDPTRTSIFDYVGVPAHQRFMNEGKFDGGQSSKSELSLRAFYENVMGIAANNAAVHGDYVDLHSLNLNTKDSAYSEQQFAFARVKDGQGFIVISNFSEEPISDVVLTLPTTLFSKDTEALELPALLDHDTVSIIKSGAHYSASLTLDGLETQVFAF